MRRICVTNKNKLRTNCDSFTSKLRENKTERHSRERRETLIRMSHDRRASVVNVSQCRRICVVIGLCFRPTWSGNIYVSLKQLSHIDSFRMPSKGKRGRGRGGVAASPAPQPTSDEAEKKSSVVSDEESSDVSTVSQTTETKKKKITVERERQYPWKDATRNWPSSGWTTPYSTTKLLAEFLQCNGGKLEEAEDLNCGFIVYCLFDSK